MRPSTASQAAPVAFSSPEGERGERGLVERARDGDVEAFEALYRRHVGRVHALCLRMCRDGAQAEELTQEAFVRAWQKLDSFRGESAFGSWLHRLAANVVIAAFRTAGRYRARVIAFEDPREEDRARDHRQDSSASGHDSPTALALDLERAIARLPAGARMVFVLHDIEGWKHRDIAERLGLAENTSKTQLHRARQLLRRALGSPALERPTP
ncbi:MAG: RNA polymerase sigma factor [Holophagales bacterium]|nr:RNA polymerase sigma factor [Holophagales bacterium]